MAKVIFFTSKEIDEQSIWFLAPIVLHHDTSILKLTTKKKSPNRKNWPLIAYNLLAKILRKSLVLLLIREYGFKEIRSVKNLPTRIAGSKYINEENFALGIIITDEIIDPSRYNFPIINLHHGDIGLYKGRDCLYWEAYESGRITATVHIINEKIDRGPILKKCAFKKTRVLEIDRLLLDLELGKWLRDEIAGVGITATINPENSCLRRTAPLFVRLIGSFRYLLT